MVQEIVVGVRQRGGVTGTPTRKLDRRGVLREKRIAKKIVGNPTGPGPRIGSQGILRMGTG